MALAVGDIFEARFVCELPPQISVNVWHLRVTAIAGTSATEQDLATAIDQLVAIPFKGVISDDSVYRGVGVKRIWPTPVGTEVFGTAGAGAGTNLGTVLPKQIAALISKRTATGGAHGRGRMYVPFPNEENSELTGVPSAAYRALVATLAGAFVGNKTAGTAPNTATYVFGVLRRDTNAISDVNQMIVRSKWATQRRRGDFGASNVPPF